jgi:putative transcriptional regulator
MSSLLVMENTLDTGDDDKYALQVKNRVRELRVAGDLSQEGLGSVLGVSRQTINSIENGRYLPSLPLAIAIARFFDTTVEQVFELEGMERTR